MLAAELRDKTRSLGRAEKPPPPQKAKRSVLPASTARAASASEASASEKVAASAPEPETPRKKTPIQKPPRKKSREAAGSRAGRARPPELPRLAAPGATAFLTVVSPRSRSEGISLARAPSARSSLCLIGLGSSSLHVVGSALGPRRHLAGYPLPLANLWSFFSNLRLLGHSLRSLQTSYWPRRVFLPGPPCHWPMPAALLLLGCLSFAKAWCLWL